MMRLVSASDPGLVTEYNVRAHYQQRLVLTASVCRELQRAPDKLTGGRPQEALALLTWWMRQVYDLPPRDVDYLHGLDHPRLAEFASDMQRELELGAKVCKAYFMAYTADKKWELDQDIKNTKRRLDEFLAEFDV